MSIFSKSTLNQLNAAVNLLKAEHQFSKPSVKFDFSALVLVDTRTGDHLILSNTDASAAIVRDYLHDILCADIGEIEEHLEKGGNDEQSH